MPSTIAIAIGALAGAAAALPATVPGNAPLQKTADFGLVLEAEAPYNGLVLRSEHDGPSVRALVFERPSAYAPENVFLNGTDAELASFAYLDFYGTAQEAGYFGVVLPDVGHVDGAVHPITARLGVGQDAAGTASFANNNGYLAGKLTATTNQFLACNITLNAGTAFGLAYGNSKTDGSLPDGCVAAKLAVVDLSGYDA